MEQDHEQSQLLCSNREKVPRYRFRIEGEAFMIVHDEGEPKTIQEALSCPTSKECIKVMEEEMKSNKFGTLLIYFQVVRPLGTSGFSIIIIRQIGQMTYIKLDW